MFDISLVIKFLIFIILVITVYNILIKNKIIKGNQGSGENDYSSKTMKRYEDINKYYKSIKFSHTTFLGFNISEILSCNLIFNFSNDSNLNFNLSNSTKVINRKLIIATNNILNLLEDLFN